MYYTFTRKQLTFSIWRYQLENEICIRKQLTFSTIGILLWEYVVLDWKFVIDWTITHRACSIKLNKQKYKKITNFEKWVSSDWGGFQSTNEGTIHLFIFHAN